MATLVRQSETATAGSLLPSTAPLQLIDHDPADLFTGLDIPYPPPRLERFHLPDAHRILDAIARLQWEEDNA